MCGGKGVPDLRLTVLVDGRSNATLPNGSKYTLNVF